VNLLSIYALANFPLHGTFSASKAAAHSLAQCLRAEMRPAGVRVINLFPARSTTSGTSSCPRRRSHRSASPMPWSRPLREGVEDVYPGDVAQEWLARWRDNPKAWRRSFPRNERARAAGKGSRLERSES